MNSKKWIKLLKVCIICMALEIFLFNHSFWLSLGYQCFQNYKFKFNGIQNEMLNDSRLLEKDSYIEISELNCNVKNIYIEIETDKKDRKEREDVLKIQIHLSDEGNQEYYSLPVRTVSTHLNKSNYISLHPYGKINRMMITFPGEEGHNISIHNITFNKPVPMYFSVTRIGIMVSVYFTYIALFCKSYNEKYDRRSKTQLIRTSLYCAIVIVLGILLIYQSNNYGIGFGNSSQYQQLARAMAEGHLYLSDKLDSRLVNAQNPYDLSERIKIGLDYFYNWDIAYYEERSYVYFGVLPVILFYLPYYALTGCDLPHVYPQIFFYVLLIIGCFYFVAKLVEKYFDKLPYRMYIIFTITFIMGIRTFMLIKRVCIYNMSILGGLCLTVLGLALWLDSQDTGGKCNNIKIFIGSLCMALVVTVRPQFLIASFLVIPIFSRWFMRVFSEIKCKNIQLRTRLTEIFCFSIPYIFVAIGQMTYNYKRFGSVLDFGANYNITTNDMLHRGFNLARFVPGIWSYLFQLPRLNIEFPFVEVTQVQTEYQGITIQESCTGGVIITNMILWSCFMFYAYRKQLKRNQAFLSTCICLLSAVIVVCVDTQMAGILNRYQADFSIFFFIAAYLILLTFLKEISTNQGDCIKYSIDFVFKGILFLCLITIIYYTLLIFSNSEVPDYQTTNPLWYYKVKELLGLFDL